MFESQKTSFPLVTMLVSYACAVHYLVPDKAKVNLNEQGYIFDQKTSQTSTHVCSDQTPGYIYSHENITSSHIIIAAKENSSYPTYSRNFQVLEPIGTFRKSSDLTFCSIVFSPAPPATSLLLVIESYSHPCPNLLFLCSAQNHPKGACKISTKIPRGHSFVLRKVIRIP